MPLWSRFSLKSVHKINFINGKIFKYAVQRKQSTTVLASGYQPKEVETNQQNHLQTEERTCNRGQFRMILPPPNVTGHLHLGHALMATIQDVICRRRRQLGYEVKWIPGTDHAGIATQVVVEKKLLKERGETRQQIGREAFLNDVWKWKNEKGKGIIEDLKKLGCTLNWDQEYFTMDDNQANAVNLAFIKLFDEGLIQRKKSLINWSCALQSAISDIEVDVIEVKGPTEIAVPRYERNIKFGLIYNFSYKLCNKIDGIDEIVVSTTRPETMLGDVAIAVHPEDPRYSKLRNESCVELWHPFRKEKIPLIFDVTVEQSFGTGAVKITPAHDKADFEIAQRHLLQGKPVFDENGNILAEYEEFSGLPRFDARERILTALHEQQLLRGQMEHAMNLPICSRSKDIIEYMLREQWFLQCRDMADAAMAEVRSGRLQILPTNYEVDWQRWLENCQDWCISRQLWWGHRIPAYSVSADNGNTCWIAALSEQEALEKAKVKLQSDNLKIERRDDDVLDTWFSSALLPFSAFGWPKASYQQHYPIDLMETGHDILFFWVARMVMLGLQLTGEIPFKKILLNGIICDAQGRKMSKSLGNVVTPQQVIEGVTLAQLQHEQQKSHASGLISAAELKRSEKDLQKMYPNGIPACGTDALRLTLCSHNIKHRFINFDVAECHTNKLFLNKIWQATRFCLNAAENLKMPIKEIECLTNVQLNLWDRWILSRLASTLSISSESFDDFNFHTEIAALKQFFYNNLCDVYLETTKAAINAQQHSGYINCATLATCLSWALQALVPYTPFVCAALLQHLPKRIHLNLNEYRDSQLEHDIEEILGVCHAIRQLKSQNKISKKHAPVVHVFAHSEDSYNQLQPHLSAMKALTLTNEIKLKHELAPAAEKNFKFFSTAGHLCSFGISTNETHRLEQSSLESQNINRKKLHKLQAELERYRLRAESEGFRKSATKEVQQKHFDKIKKLEIEIKTIETLAN